MGIKAETTNQPTTEWIGVTEVAAELGITERSAWELLRRLGVRCTDRRRKAARFRLAEYREKLDAGLVAPEPRAAYVRAIPPAPASPKPAPPKKPAKKTSRLRGLS